MKHLLSGARIEVSKLVDVWPESTTLFKGMMLTFAPPEAFRVIRMVNIVPNVLLFDPFSFPDVMAKVRYSDS